MEVEPLISKFCHSGMEKLVDDTSTPLHGKDKVFLNGNWVGVCADSLAFVTELRRRRRRKQLPNQVCFRFCGLFSFTLFWFWNSSYIDVM